MVLKLKVLGCVLLIWLSGLAAALLVASLPGCSSVSTLSDLASAIKILTELGWI